MAKSKKSSKAFTLPTHWLTFFCILVAATPIVSVYSQFLGNSIGVVTAHPWMSMASWLQVSMTAFTGFALYRQGKATISMSLSSLLLLTLMLWIISTSLWAHNKFEAFSYILYWLTAIIGFFIITTWMQSKHWEQLLQFVFASGVIAAIVGIAQYLTSFSWVVQAAPPASFFGNKNMGAHYALMTFPLGIALYWVNQSTAKQWFYAIGTALIQIYILYTFARAAWLSMAIAIVYFILVLWLIRKQSKQSFINKTRLQTLLVSLTFIICMVHIDRTGFNPSAITGFNEELQSIGKQATTNFESSNVRLIKWRNAVDLYLDNWLFGIGVNNWLIEYPIYHQLHGFDFGVRLDSQSNHTHNDYIQLIVETGTIGLILFIALIVLVLRHLWRFFKNEENSFQQKMLLSGIIGCLIAIGFDALFSFPLQLPHTLFLFVVYLTLITSSEQNKWQWSLPKSTTKPISIGFMAASLTSIILFVQWFEAEIWYRKTHFQVETKQYTEAIVSAEKAYKHNPYKYDMLKYKAITYKKLNHPNTEKAIMEVLDSYPNNLNSLNRAVNYYSTTGQFQKALPLANHMQSLAPRSGYVYQNLAAIYQGLGKNDLVIQNIKKLLEVQPDHPSAEAYRKLVNQ